MAWGQIGRSVEIILSFLLLILVVRRLTVTDFSTYSTIINFANFLVLLTSLGLSEGLAKYLPILRNTQAEAQVWLIRYFFGLRIIVNLAAGLLLWLFSPILAQWFSEPLLAKEPLLAISLFFFYTLLEVVMGLFSAHFWIKQLEVVRLSGQFSSLVFVAIWFWLVSPNIYILLASLCLVNLGMNLACLFFAFRQGLFSTSKQLVARAPLHLQEIILFCRDIWLIKLVNIGLSGQIDVLLLAAFASNQAEVGYYNLAILLIIRLWSVLIGWTSSLNSVAASVSVEQGRPALIRYFGYYYRFNLVLQGVAMVGLGLVSTSLVILVFGKRYEPASLLILVFVIQQIMNMLAGSAVTPAFINILGRQNIMLRWHAFFSLLNVLLDLLFIPWWGALGAVIATTIANSLVGLVDLWLMRELARHLNVGFPLKILAGVVSGGLVASLFRGETFLSLVICAAVYLLYLVAFMLIVKPLEQADRQLVIRLRPGLSRFLRYF